MKKLGFGMMRLPMPDAKVQDKVDFEQVCTMVDTFLERGFTYFDTAYMYHGGISEHVVRQAVVERHPRESFTVADKMPMMRFKENDTEQEQARIFDEQLAKCGVEYFDYYLLHNLNSRDYPTTKRLNTFQFLLQKKADGKIRHLGFSFHDKADLLDQILTEHPEVDFVQLQLNYLDWEDERVQSRKCYETVVKHNKKVVVMEPVKGGRLANVPTEVEQMMRAAHPDWSPASWAIRFAASLEHVMMVLSGMSNTDQLLDNTNYMQNFVPLTEDEVKLLEKAAEIISAQPAIACTACRYCVDGCPRDIQIPDFFMLYNQDQMTLRQGGSANREEYRKRAEGHGFASSCVDCKQCESACPQHLPITSLLQRVVNTYEKA